MKAGRARGERAGLTTAAVVAAARELAVRTGPSGLSLRQVAQHLGVVPNALYAHVASRDELLDLVLDDVLGDVDANPSGAPLHRVLAVFLGTYDALVRHPALAPAFLSRQGVRGLRAVALGRVVDDALAELGAPRDGIDDIRRALITQVIGFAAFTAASPDPDPEARARYEQALGWLLGGALGSGAVG